MSQLARKSYTIAPSDGTDLPNPITQLYVGTGGTIKLQLAKDAPADAVTLTVSSGTILSNLIIKRIWSTGTSASGLIGFA